MALVLSYLWVNLRESMVASFLMTNELSGRMHHSVAKWWYCFCFYRQLEEVTKVIAQIKGRIKLVSAGVVSCFVTIQLELENHC